MPISPAVVTITEGQGIVPSSSWYLTGADGNHYMPVGTAGTDVTDQIKLGCCETGTTVWTLDHTEFTTAVAALSLDGGGGAITSPVLGIAHGPIPIPGTKYFYVAGNGEDPAGAFWVIFLRYRIESTVLIEVDGAVVYKRIITDGVAPASGCWCFGANIVDDQLFAVCWMFHGDGTYLIRIPSDGFGTTTIETNTAIWTSRRTYVGGAAAFGDVSGAPEYFQNPSDFLNRCCILKAPAANSVRILTYRSHDSVPSAETDLTTPGSEYVDVNYVTQTVGSLTNAQSSLSQPWADEGLGYSGTVTSDPDRDRYTGPTVVDNEVCFARCFADNLSTVRIRRFAYDETTGTFTPYSTAEGTISLGGSQPNVNRAALATREGERLLIAKYGFIGWVVDQVTVSLTSPGEGWKRLGGPHPGAYEPRFLYPGYWTIAPKRDVLLAAQSLYNEARQVVPRTRQGGLIPAKYMIDGEDRDWLPPQSYIIFEEMARSQTTMRKLQDAVNAHKPRT